MDINLQPAVSPNDRSFYDVPNDSPSRIDIFAGYNAGPNPGFPPLTVVIDGQSFVGRNAVEGNWNTFSGDCVDIDGTLIHVELVLHSVTRTVNSGRAHYRIITWFINSGKITF